MKSFPSTINQAQNMYGGSGKFSSYEKSFDIDRLKSGALNLNKSIPIVQEMLKNDNINIANFQAYPSMVTMFPSDLSDINNTVSTSNILSQSSNGQVSTSAKERIKDAKNSRVYFENPLQFPAEAIALAKDYDWAYKYRVKNLLSIGQKFDQSLKVPVANTAIAPSMFNPMYGVSVLGITRNTPLLNETEDSEIDEKTSDCSIRTLCALSKNANNPLGQSRYKYADFMYCKDLGKVANNHLITLRKFAHPIGDHIGRGTNPAFMREGELAFQAEGDIGRLVSWFGTDDNRLEDICKFSYHATWKELNAQIEEKDSQADDSSSGLIGMISNGLNPVYNDGVNAGTAGNHSIWGWLGSKTGLPVFQGIGKNNGLLRNYDNNKVYTPKNTIQSTNIYEGKLEFSHEFTLNFSYQLRAYDNINPRSAMLDLLGNILEVTYRRGKFWKGDRKLIGPAQDMAPFDKTSAFIDNAFDKLGGFFNSLMNGGINFMDILGKIGSVWNSAAGAIMNAAKGGAGEMASAAASYVKNIFTSSGAVEAGKGYLKNALGRPTLYAWQSFLSGDDVGLWHVTIGNPRNPILSIGNLILTNATVQQSGPLGIDDFPTELKVSVTLKHARPRDVTDISRMYTQGTNAIYYVMAHHKIDDFWGDAEVQGSADGNQTVNAGDAKKTTNKQSQEAYKKDVAEYSDSTQHPYNERVDVDAAYVANPFIESKENSWILRTNNWSKTMFSMSLQEAA